MDYEPFERCAWAFVRRDYPVAASIAMDVLRTGVSLGMAQILTNLRRMGMSPDDDALTQTLHEAVGDPWESGDPISLHRVEFRSLPPLARGPEDRAGAVKPFMREGAPCPSGDLVAVVFALEAWAGAGRVVRAAASPRARASASSTASTR